MATTFTPLTPRKSFPLLDLDEPELYREQFPWTAVPRILFDGTDPAPRPAKNIWITDTTFRDGQQARPPYTPEQVGTIFDFLHELGGKEGIIRQSEFFVYSSRDLEALEVCRSRNYTYPEITSWIRADHKDLAIVKSLGLKETGILTSVSDYHIFLKLKKNRPKVMEDYLSVVKAALEAGLVPRCHFEDITRADIYGFCLPLAEELLKLAQEAGRPVKIRLCDTMGFGVTYPGAVLPRSVPKLVHAFAGELGYPSEWLEWHGHNDFHKVHVNAATAWLYGCSSLNATVLGFGERTGNPPLEAAVIEWLSLTGRDDAVDTRVITRMAEWFQREVNAPIPAGYPFVGADFNCTRAGIHADGILKNQEIYNIFDTELLLDRPLKVQVTDKSGVAGIAGWLNENIAEIKEGRAEPVNKRQNGVRHIYRWVMDQYEAGRTTSISPEEMEALARRFLPSLFVSDFDRAREEASRIAGIIADEVSESDAVRNFNPDNPEPLEDYLAEKVASEASIQLCALANPEGKRITQVHTQRGEKAMFRNLLNKDFRKHDWFVEVTETGADYISDLFFSKYTGRLIMTAARPIRNKDGALIAVLDIDFRFDELVKLINPLTGGSLHLPTLADTNAHHLLGEMPGVPNDYA